MRSTVRRAILATLLALTLALAGLLLPGTPRPGPVGAAGSCVVTAAADSGPGSLREKLADATCAAITFTLPTPSTITLASDLPLITRAVSVTGPGAALLTIDRNNRFLDSTTGDFARAFVVGDGGDLALTGLTVTGANLGLALSGTGRVTVAATTFRGNAAGIYMSGGGTAIVTGSAFDGNNRGIGFFLGGSATVANSTFGGNPVVLQFTQGGVATVTGSTISNASDIAIVFTLGGQLTLANTLLAAGGTNCASRGGTLVNAGQNLADDATCFADGASGSRVVTGGANPLGLDPAGLRDNGGPTPTIALLPTSPAVDAGDAATCAATGAGATNGADQRGVARPQGTGCDIGAYEYAPPCVVTNTNDTGAGSLRAALGRTDDFAAFACANIVFAPGVTGTITLGSDLPIVTRTVFVTGPGAPSLTVNRNSRASGSAFPVAPTGNLTLRGLTVSRAGFGVYLNGGGAATLDAVVLSGHVVGLEVSGGNAIVTNSTFNENGDGVAAINGNVVVANSTIVGSSTAALYIAFSSNVTVIGSTLSGNSWGVHFSRGGSATLANTLVANGQDANCTSFLVEGTFTNGGHNLMDDASCFADGASGSKVVAAGQTGLDPAGLADHGGPTRTIALLPGSPAIDAGDPDRCAATGAGATNGADQRGIVRPQPADGACDIGAFESRGFALAPLGGGDQRTVFGTPFANPLVVGVSSAFGEPVAGGAVTFTGPASGAGIAGGPVTVAIGADGHATLPAPTANATTGAFNVDVTAAGQLNTLAFGLTNTAIPTTLAADPASGTYGGTATLSAKLTVTAGGTSVVGQTIAFTLNGTAVCGNAPGGYPAPCPTTDGGGVATLSNVALGAIGAGSYPAGVGAAYAGDATRAASTGTNALVVAKAPSVTRATAPGATYTGGPYTGASARATGAGGLDQAVTGFSYRGRNATAYGPSATAPTNAGDYIATATFDGDANHDGSDGGAEFTIARGTQTITFAPLPDRALGEAPFTLAATASSGLPVAFAAGPVGVCTASGATVTLVAMGDCTVTASQPGDANHLAATPVARTFQVARLATVTATRGDATYGDAVTILTATVTRATDGKPVPAGGAVTFTFGGRSYPATTDARGIATATVPLPAGQAAGTFANRVQASYAGVAAALPSADTGPLVVARRILTVKPVDQTVRLKQPNPTGCALELAPGSAFVNGDGWASVSTANLRCTSTRNYPASNAAETVGKTYKLSATGFSSANYDLRVQLGTLTVVP